MDDDRIGGPVGKFRAGERAALLAVLRIGRGVLIGDLGERQPLHADAAPRSFIIVNMALMPRCSSPISQPVAPS